MKTWIVLALFLSVNSYGATDFSDRAVRSAMSCLNQLEPHDDYSYPYTPPEFKERHPAFFGCFDWHASVFNHAVLLHVLNENPDSPRAADIKALLASHFTQANVDIELKNMEKDILLKLYEPAWFLHLMMELRQAKFPEAAIWAERLKPMEALAIRIFSEELPQWRYADTNMMHQNTAYTLKLAWDAASAAQNAELLSLISARAKYFYLGDVDCDAAHEVDDSHNIIGFISPCFAEADLMRRILPAPEFAKWFKGFFPTLPNDFLTPVAPRGRYGYYQVGLMLHKAWAMRGLARIVTDQDLSRRLRAAADVQSSTAQKVMYDFGYIGEHWLPAFFLYSETEK